MSIQLLQTSPSRTIFSILYAFQFSFIAFFPSIYDLLFSSLFAALPITPSNLSIFFFFLIHLFSSFFSSPPLFLMIIIGILFAPLFHTIYSFFFLIQLNRIFNMTIVDKLKRKWKAYMVIANKPHPYHQR